MDYDGLDVIEAMPVSQSLVTALAQVAGLQGLVIFSDSQKVVGCNDRAKEILCRPDLLLTSLSDLWASDTRIEQHTELFRGFSLGSPTRAMAGGFRVPFLCGDGKVKTFTIAIAILESLPSRLGVMRLAVISE